MKLITTGQRALRVAAGCILILAAPVLAQSAVNAPVTVTDNGGTWTLDDGVVKAIINKHNGAMDSLLYKGIDTLGHEQGQPGCWEQDPSAAAAVGGLTNSITIDPSQNGGERAEVSVKGVTGGQVQLSSGAPGGGTYCDMEIRYASGNGRQPPGAGYSALISGRGGGAGSGSRLGAFPSML